MKFTFISLNFSKSARIYKQHQPPLHIAAITRPPAGSQS